MRTSGASSDPIYYIPVLVAIAAVVMIFGGPQNVMRWVEYALRTLLTAASQVVQSIVG